MFAGNGYVLYADANHLSDHNLRNHTFPGSILLQFADRIFFIVTSESSASQTNQNLCAENPLSSFSFQ